MTSLYLYSVRSIGAGEVFLMSNVGIEWNVIMSAPSTLTGGMSCGMECYENNSHECLEDSSLLLDPNLP